MPEFRRVASSPAAPTSATLEGADSVGFSGDSSLESSPSQGAARTEPSATVAPAGSTEAGDSKRTLEALLRCIPECVAIADAPDLTVRAISDYALRMAGQKDGLQARRITTADHPALGSIVHLDGVTAARPGELPLSRAVLDGEVVVNEEWLLQRADGRLIPILCNAGPIRDDRERVTGGIVAWRDISELAEAQAALRRSEARFRTAQELSLDGFTILSPVRDEAGLIIDFEWQYVNPKACSLMRLNARDLIGRRLLQVLPGTKQTGNLFERYVEVVETGVSHDIELYYDADGITGWFRNMAVKLGGDVAVTFRDISKRRRAEEERRVALEQKDLLIREVNHRVKNSLQLVSSLLSLQARQINDPGVQRKFHDAVSRILTIAHVHEQLCRIEHIRTVAFGLYLRELCADLERSASTDERSHILVDAADIELPVAQAIPLALIVNELVTNACKYARPGGACTVTVSFAARPEGGWSLSVADDGIGLPDGFDLAAPGSLGLRLISALATQLGGTVAIDRTAPGACFRVDLAELGAP